MERVHSSTKRKALPKGLQPAVHTYLQHSHSYAKATNNQVWHTRLWNRTLCACNTVCCCPFSLQSWEMICITVQLPCCLSSEAHGKHCSIPFCREKSPSQSLNRKERVWRFAVILPTTPWWAKPVLSAEPPHSEQSFWCVNKEKPLTWCPPTAADTGYESCGYTEW